MTICMTNGGLYSDIKSINGRDVSDIKLETIVEILENDKFMTIVFKNNSHKSILRVSCISSINLF